DPLLRGTDAFRLANAEADGLPGLIVDRYAGVAVVRAATPAMALRRDEVAAFLLETGTGRSVGPRGDATAAGREGFEAVEGALAGEAQAGGVAIQEHGRRYEVDVLRGQKTGFYLDQRDARSLVERLAEGRRVLDLFCYTGGFAAAAARGRAAPVPLLDSSAAALAQARLHVERNRRAPALEARALHGDAFEAARRLTDAYDLIVLDPPPLARRSAGAPRARRAYKD